MPFRTSNIPTKIFYSAVGAEILRIGRTTSGVSDFVKSASSLMLRVSKQGAIREKVLKILQKTYGRHDILKQFGDNSRVFIRNVFSR